MTILQPSTQQRRGPTGRHKCPACGAIFALGAEDLPKLHDGTSGDMYVDCPCCTIWVRVNGLGATEPPAP